MPVRQAACLLLGAMIWLPADALADPPGRGKPVTIGRICALIGREAERNVLPRDFFARLIFKESRFDPGAISPVGAEGIAQFMPGTAAMRGLDDSFDIGKAIPASAKYLAELKMGFGNLGLAAAAYNAGEARVSRWLSAGGYLPMETESYVLDVMGEPVDKFSDPKYAGTVQPLDSKKTFEVACRQLRSIRSPIVAMSTVSVKPWGIQVAGNFRRDAAVRQWQRVSRRIAKAVAGHEPVVSRIRSPRGRRGIYVVRIGAGSRPEADRICQEIQSVGGSCVVLRNR